MRATDELVAQLWDSLIADGWKSPDNPTSAISKFIESLPDERVSLEQTERVGAVEVRTRIYHEHVESGDESYSIPHEFPAGFVWINRRVIVQGEDFKYQATCLCSFPKSNGKVRYIVEDNGRLFIQKDGQLTFIADRPFNPEPKPGTEPPPGYKAPSIKHPDTCECGECWQIMEGSGRG